MLTLSVAKGTGVSGHSCVSLCVVEELESRLLLSSLPVATPDFLLYYPSPSQYVSVRIGETLDSISRLPTEPTMRTGYRVYQGDSLQPAQSASPIGLDPATIRHAYGIDVTVFGAIVGDGSGQTIAIVDAYNAPTIVADLHAFDVQFGLPDPPSFTIISQTGSTVLLPPNAPLGGWAVETSLDVEWAHAVAPMADILLVEATSASTYDLFMAVDTARNYPGVSVVSMSWGRAEFSGQRVYDSYFTTPLEHTGVTFIASSGDSGAYDLSGNVSVSYPAASPYVLSVGGTYLTTDVDGVYISETGWGDGPSSYFSGGSGGGISLYSRQPSYQKGIAEQSRIYRTVPDVSMVADPASGVAVYDSYDNGGATPWAQVGGTSLAAPLWAGVIAMANQGRVLAGQSTLDGPTETLPKLYALPPSYFHDITTGDNGYSAGPGYDLVTGLGSPVVDLLAVQLASTTTATMPVRRVPRPFAG